MTAAGPTRRCAITASAAVDGRLDVRAGVAPEPAATVTAESTVWSGVLFDDLPLARAERDGTVRVEGDRQAVVRVVRLYFPGD